MVDKSTFNHPKNYPHSRDYFNSAAPMLGMSGITGMTSFTNTFLFSFLDTFCFPGDTLLRVVREQEGKKQVTEIPIREVVIGDRLYPSMDRVTALFQFQATGQPMVRLGDVLVSTNHYLYDSAQNGKRVHIGMIS